MTQPTLTINRLRKEMDEKCEYILNTLVVRAWQEGDAIRYNELYRIVKELLKISKPTFNEHLGHLIKKKLIKRKRVGKQETRFYLNIMNPEIAKLGETKDQIDRITETLTSKLQEQNWVNAPTLLAWTCSILQLRRLKTIVECFSTPEKADENILAVAYEAKYQGIIENLILLSLVNATSKIKGPEKQEAVKKMIVEALDSAAQKMQNALSNLVKKE